MRLIWSSTNRDETDRVCQNLSSEKISYSLDVKKDIDWNNDTYGSFVFCVWIQDENDLEKAKQVLASLTSSPVTDTSVINAPQEPIEQFLQLKLHAKFPHSLPTDTRKSPFTFFLLLLCVFLFMIDGYRDLSLPQPYVTPTAFSKVRKELFFDYPTATRTLDAIVEQYGPQELTTQPPSAQVADLRKKLSQSFVWEGIYPYAVAAFTHVYQNIPPYADTPLFERLRVGEIWRLVTPAFLHGSLLHLLFNMSWLIGVGQQIERRISSWRYLLLIIICAATANISQYLMSGPFFLGFSGVICGFVGFIASRQQVAPWELYFFSRQTYRFLLGFISLFAALSILGFLQECAGRGPTGSYFANTAHVTGLITGLLLGRCKLFRMKSK